ncbi:hypothetical protein M8756_01710 [Lutimaribacter sp. EGI FJ00015]|uniref:DUF7742 family protein n=1 Tax=Lutimaribacter degradans TaxID=2945989 RepID=UPI00207C9974|nr:hypothetical protein [Lutimaribacter sp. EGI FJ00015]MCO0634871.1 hypothetical protein [Lutimaribacter sp. EGI FJ00014]
MRRITHGDVTTAARALIRHGPDQRGRVLATLLDRTRAADLYRRRFGRAHPQWGDGTLAAAACRGGFPDEPGLHVPDYLECLVLVLSALLARKTYPCAQEMHFGVAGSSSSRLGEISSPQSTQ